MPCDSAQLAKWATEQQRMRALIQQTDAVSWKLPGEDDREGEPLQFVGGLDISFAAEKESGAGECSQASVACLTVVDITGPSIATVHQDFETLSLDVPYKAGFLGFREVPAFKMLLDRIPPNTARPQVLLVDGFGVLHKRRCGSASHLGVQTGYPTVGVGKTLLMCLDGQLRERYVKSVIVQALHCVQATGALPDGCREHIFRMQSRSGHTAVCMDLKAGDGTVLGVAAAGHSSEAHCVRPIYVSVGHKVSLDTALRITMACCDYKVPEPIRRSDLASREYIRRTERQRSVSDDGVR